MKINGQNVITGLHNPSNVPFTPSQLEQQMVFKLVQSFVRKVTAVMRLGYQSHKQKRSAYNEAMSYHLKNLVTGSYPDLAIDPEMAIFSRGILNPSTGTSVEALTGHVVKFTWASPEASGDAPTDNATLIVYNEQLERFVVGLNAAARTALSFEFHLPSAFIGKIVHCYIFFASADKKNVSDSEYLGVVTVI